MGKYGKYRALVGCIAGLMAGPATAACQLALVLALDVSSSVDDREYVLQRDGLASALMSDRVQSLIFSGAGDIAIAAYEWSGYHQQFMILEWTMLSDQAALQTAVETIHKTQRRRNDMPTSIGAAIGFASTIFQRAPDCERYTLDISGDGVHNHRYSPSHAYDAFPLDHVTVNGLVIIGHHPEVVDHYLTQVIKGPSAFVEVTPNFDKYQSAMERKLMREIGAMAIGQLEVLHENPTP